MRFVPTPLDGAFVIELDKREDDRGFFARAFCEREFAAAGLDARFVQINNSLSKDKGTLRGGSEGGALRARRAVGCDPRFAAGVGEFRAELWRRAQRREPAHDVCAARLCPRFPDARRGYRGVLPRHGFLRPGARARYALERPSLQDTLAGRA